MKISGRAVGPHEINTTVRADGGRENAGTRIDGLGEALWLTPRPAHAINTPQISAVSGEGFAIEIAVQRFPLSFRGPV